MIEARGISVGYGKGSVLRGIDLSFEAGRITALIGANGCGKSTLLRALAGLHPLQAGEVLLDGQAIARIPRREVARRLSFLTQSPEAPEGVSVEQLVAHGGFARAKTFAPALPGDVMQALQMTGCEDFAQRPFTALSGGERQRVWIAMALMQDTPMMLLDEPTSFLDMGQQIGILELLESLSRTRGLGVLMVLHDINQASRYAERIIALKDGGVAADGPPGEVVTSALVQSLYGARVEVMRDKTGQHPYCLPHGRI